MDKRLLIVLPLCLVILIGWNMFMASRRPPPPRPQPQAPVQQAPAAQPGEQPPAAESRPLVGEVLRGDKEVERTFRIGTPGAKGSYELDFTNRGGALIELHLGDYFDKAALTEAERADSKHWTRLATQIETAQGKTRSFLLGTSASSRELASAPLEDELWVMRTLGEEAAPTGVEFKLAPGTGMVFTKRFLWDPLESTCRHASLSIL